MFKISTLFPLLPTNSFGSTQYLPLICEWLHQPQSNCCWQRFPFHLALPERWYQNRIYIVLWLQMPHKWPRLWLRLRPACHGDYVRHRCRANVIFQLKMAIGSVYFTLWVRRWPTWKEDERRKHRQKIRKFCVKLNKNLVIFHMVIGNICMGQYLSSK